MLSIKGTKEAIRESIGRGILTDNEPLKELVTSGEQGQRSLSPYEKVMTGLFKQSELLQQSLHRRICI